MAVNRFQTAANLAAGVNPFQQAATLASSGGGTRDWTRQQIIDETIRQANAAGADAAVILAVFEKESGFNERAVGDGGNSFGLRQLNRYGQLYGRSPEWAMDPRNAIPEAVRALAKASTAAQATAVQNPANKAAYQRSLQQLIDKWRGILGGGGGSTKARAKWSPLRDQVRAKAKQLGLRHTSGDRSPSRNAAAGGVSNSDHLSTKAESWADDYVGSEAAMAQLVGWALANGAKQAMVHDAGSGRHAHIAGHSTVVTGGTSPAGADGAAVDDPTMHQAGMFGLSLPGKQDVLRWIFVFLLVILGMAIFAMGLAKSFGGVPTPLGKVGA